MSRLSLCCVNMSHRERQDFEAARKKALQVGAKKFFLEVRFGFLFSATSDSTTLCRTSSANLSQISSTPLSRLTQYTR